ncbi:hypothetical protein APHMUC_1024 [Anaplasma phagocytophilum str. ApMUC09]|uniref:Uncharacterized protein n=1 Tax=Anaplasma phagocytophilum str. ApMUC09 TaxID=1359152 RepID=A0A0F3N7Y0_ANAPH|nr:hypothetical protein APHMUC_1024 [Anaplasma phagocytophilum str. ApMUC09]
MRVKHNIATTGGLRAPVVAVQVRVSALILYYILMLTYHYSIMDWNVVFD